MKFLFSCSDVPEVSLLKGLLDEAGITAELRNESVYPVMPGAAFQPEVWVSDEDYERACEVLNTWRQTVPGQGVGESAVDIESSRTDARFRGLAGVLMIAGAVWVCIKCSRAELGVGALILFAVPGAILVWSAVAQLRALGRRGKIEAPTNGSSR